MKDLSDLEATFVGKYNPTSDSFFEGLTFSEAQGVMFTCPLCEGHQVLCWFKDRGVPDSAEPGPGRWTPTGTSIKDLTLSPSVNLDTKTPEFYQQYPNTCRWHGWVANGGCK